MTIDAKKCIGLILLVPLLYSCLSNSNNDSNSSPKSVASPLSSPTVEPSAAETLVEPASKEATEPARVKTPTATVKPKTATKKSTSSKDSPKGVSNTQSNSIDVDLGIVDCPFPVDNKQMYLDVIPELPSDCIPFIEGKNFQEGYYYNLNPKRCITHLYTSKGEIYDKTWTDNEVLVIYIKKGEMLGNGCPLTKGLPVFNKSSQIKPGIVPANSIEAGTYTSNAFFCKYWNLPTLMELARGEFDNSNTKWVEEGKSINIKNDGTYYLFYHECSLIKQN